MSIAAELQIAIFNTLNGNLGGVPVFSMGDAPDNLQAVYVTIGNDTHIPWDDDNLTGFESTLTIHVFDTTGQRGFVNVKPLMGACYDLLHRATISINGYTLLGIDQEFEDARIDADGLTPHGVLRYRVITETN